jgi:hypothetical protein
VSILRNWLGGDLGVEPMGLPFYHMVTTVWRRFRGISKFSGPMEYVANMAELPPDLSVYLIYIFFNFWLLGVIGHLSTATWKPKTRPRGNQKLGHVTSLYSHHATSPLCYVILPHVVRRPRYPATYCAYSMCHVWIGTWHVSIGPHVNPKISDTWKPLMLPCHHDTCLPLGLQHKLYG